MQWLRRLILVNGILCLGMLLTGTDCNKSATTNNGNNGGNGDTLTAKADIDWWMTRADQTALLQKQSAVLSFGTTTNGNANLDVDTTSVFQSIDGFGYTLTGGSAYLINHMNSSDRIALLNELFGNGTNGIGINYLRISIGASDLDTSVFSYDDLPAGQDDTSLTHFNLSRDTVDLIPLLKQILLINPAIKILGSPWSPPPWMKDNYSTKAGGLLPQYYDAYSRYFVKYIQAMQANGITIDAVTIQNEPQNGGNNPSMVMSANEEANFISANLGPQFQSAGLQTKIIVWDHNCDNPNYPITILNNAAARPYVNGSAFHLYNGDISALTSVHQAYPDKQLYFTEQWTGSNEAFADNLNWHVKNVVIGSMRNWSRTALEWNLASDPAYSLHTPGGCTECKGAITISGSTVSRNVGYYIIAQVSKFVPAGSVRIGSSAIAGLSNVAFKTPSGSKVLLVLNDGTSLIPFNIRFKGKWVGTSVGPGTVVTFVWQ